MFSKLNSSNFTAYYWEQRNGVTFYTCSFWNIPLSKNFLPAQWKKTVKTLILENGWVNSKGVLDRNSSFLAHFWLSIYSVSAQCCSNLLCFCLAFAQFLFRFCSVLAQFWLSLSSGFFKVLLIFCSFFAHFLLSFSSV